MTQTRRNLFFTTMEASSERKTADTNSCLRASWVYTKLWGAPCVVLQIKRGSDSQSAAGVLIYRTTGTRGSLCGTVSVCTVKVPVWMAVTQIYSIKRLVEIKIEKNRSTCFPEGIWSQIHQQARWINQYGFCNFSKKRHCSSRLRVQKHQTVECWSECGSVTSVWYPMKELYLDWNSPILKYKW